MCVLIILMLYFIILANRYVSQNNIYAYYNFYKTDIKLYAVDGTPGHSTDIIRYMNFASMVALDVFSLPDY